MKETRERARIDSTDLRRSVTPSRRRAFEDRWVRGILDDMAAALVEGGEVRGDQGIERCRSSLIALRWNAAMARPVLETLLNDDQDLDDCEAAALAAGALVAGVAQPRVQAWASQRGVRAGVLAGLQALLSSR